MAINVEVTYDGDTITTLSNVSSAPITYNNSTIATLSSAGTKTLACSGKIMATNVGVGTATLACAGKLMSSNVVVTATSATNELYLIKGGVIQSGFTFEVDSIAYSSASNVAHSSTVNFKNGYIEVRGNANGSSRGGSSYRLTTDIKSIISDYSTLHVKVRRIMYNNSSWYNRIGTYNPSISGNYSSLKFLDSISKNSSSSDSSPVTLTIPLTNTTYSASKVSISFAYVTSVNRTSGNDIYDVWLT